MNVYIDLKKICFFWVVVESMWSKNIVVREFSNNFAF